MPNNPIHKFSAIKRIKKIRGQCDALERAINNDVNCSDILQQIAALRGATNALMSEVLESYLEEEFTNTDNREHIDQLKKLVKTYLK